MKPYNVKDGKLSGEYGLLEMVGVTGMFAWVMACDRFTLEGIGVFETKEDAMADALEVTSALFGKDGEDPALRAIGDKPKATKPKSKWHEMAKKHFT